MLDFTKRKPSSPLRQTFLTGGAISLALILAIMAVESYAQEPDPTGEPPVEAVEPEDMTDDDAPSVSDPAPANPMPDDGESEDMMPETVMSESTISEPIMTEAEDPILLDCPPDTVANEDGTCRLVEEEIDPADDTELEIDPERVETTLSDEP